MKISALQKWYSKIVENRKSSERGIFTHDGDSKISLRGGSLDHPGHSWYVIASLYGPIKSNLFQFHSKKKKTNGDFVHLSFCSEMSLPILSSG